MSWKTRAVHNAQRQSFEPHYFERIYLTDNLYCIKLKFNNTF